MKIAIISGASSGIGRAIAKELDNKNLDELWLVALDIEGLTSIKEELKTKVKLFALNLIENSSFDIISEALKEQNPVVSYLVCSAGIGFNGDFNLITSNNISLMINLNCLALTLMTKCAEPYLDAGSRIIEIASGSGFAPQPGFAVYAASKSYVISFSRALGKELKKKNIYVTAVCPGPVDTSFFASLDNVKEYKKKFVISPVTVAKKAIKAAEQKKSLCVPSFSMKLFHLASKVLPTSLILKFY